MSKTSLLENKQAKKTLIPEKTVSKKKNVMSILSAFCRLCTVSTLVKKLAFLREDAKIVNKPRFKSSYPPFINNILDVMFIFTYVYE